MKYFIGFLVTIGLLILLIVLLVTHHGGKPSSVTPLVSYANTGTVVRETIDGPINAPQDHRQVQITVGRDNTTFEVLQGYDNDPINTQVFPMTESAYDNFLHALQLAGYQKGNTSSSLKDDTGYCSLGNRYIFEIVNSGQSIQRYWTTSCGGGVPHSFNGNTSLVLELFQKQVPGYFTLTQNVDL
ncbi:MAG TPA: hypothetical protein VFN56_01715 [Candidatus Saccharimonadales bacterium]|nr:hypothetical protein [Candidatus Saccharimonadales bacterium]